MAQIIINNGDTFLEVRTAINSNFEELYNSSIAAGAEWFTGEGEPSSLQGKDGDYYINTLTGDVYNKASGSWSIKLNIKGPQGEPGPAGQDGTQGPKGDPGQGVPAGGIAGQVLTKKSENDYDTEWKDTSGGGDSSTLVFNTGDDIVASHPLVEYGYFSGYEKDLYDFIQACKKGIQNIIFVSNLGEMARVTSYVYDEAKDNGTIFYTIKTSYGGYATWDLEKTGRYVGIENCYANALRWCSTATASDAGDCDMFPMTYSLPVINFVDFGSDTVTDIGEGYNRLPVFKIPLSDVPGKDATMPMSYLVESKNYYGLAGRDIIEANKETSLETFTKRYKMTANFEVKSQDQLITLTDARPGDTATDKTNKKAYILVGTATVAEDWVALN